MSITLDSPAIRPLMTTEELLAMPEDGIDRELIRGELKEKQMTRRNPTHSSVEATAAWIVNAWSKARPESRGRVYCGEVGFRLRRNPDTTIGINVAYIDAETAARVPRNASLVDAPPLLAIEIISPSDKMEDILSKVQEYLDAGTKIVLLLEPVFETVTVFRPSVPPILLTGAQELTMEPHLAGFRCEAGDFFRV